MTASPEVTVGDHAYRIRRLPPMLQFHVVRRLAPILIGLGVSADTAGKLKVENPFATLAGAADALARMSEDDAEYVVNTCLTVVDRKTTKGFAPVIQGGVNMFSADLDLGTMLQLVWEVGKENLAGFTATLQLAGASLGAKDEA